MWTLIPIVALFSQGIDLDKEMEFWNFFLSILKFVGHCGVCRGTQVAAGFLFLI